jgi:hypothetical protein
LGNKVTVLYALHNAHSVRLEHYQIGWSELGRRETVLGTKDLSSDEFHKVSDAMPLLFEMGDPVLTGTKKCIFDPHHRIIIKDAAGKEDVIRVCFICDQYEVDSGPIHDIPSAWIPTFQSFFTQEGLPPSSDDY